jgi:hypothetical protein
MDHAVFEARSRLGSALTRNSGRTRYSLRSTSLALISESVGAPSLKLAARAGHIGNASATRFCVAKSAQVRGYPYKRAPRASQRKMAGPVAIGRSLKRRHHSDTAHAGDVGHQVRRALWRCQLLAATRTWRGGPSTSAVEGRTDMPFKRADFRV